MTEHIDTRRLTLREHFASLAFEQATTFVADIQRTDILHCVRFADLMVEALEMTPEQISEALNDE